MITIIAQTADFVVVNKPAGMIVHGNGAASLLAMLKAQLGTACLHPVHRLDQGTSGVLLLAKTDSANRELCDAFAARQVTKFYVALTLAKPKKKQGMIVGDMVKSRGGSFKLLASQAKPAVTLTLAKPKKKQGMIVGDMVKSRGGSFKLLASQAKPAVTCLKSFGQERAPRLWLLKPITGKTHQLRVALRAWSSPIVGDERYGGPPSDRMYLHAYCLSFPYKGRHYRYCCMPESGSHFDQQFAARLQAIGAPESLSWQV